MISIKIKYFLGLTLLFLALCLTAEVTDIATAKNENDSTGKKADSLARTTADSQKSKSADSVSKNQPDTTISYFAENIRYFVTDSSETLLLETRAVLKYKNISLTADTISLDLKTKIVTANYSIDTLKADGLTRLQDSIIQIGVPTLQEGTELITGAAISYNLDTREGKVRRSKTLMKGSTVIDNTYFQAEQLIKLDDNNLNGLKAKITSCDLEEPDYHFLADSVIVTNTDWVLAKPITLHFGKVPVAYFPFALYKKNSGRKSGLIIPSYYYSSQKGNGLKHLGFFWDISPYVDYTVTGDYYDQYGYLIDQNLRYNQKYVLDGNVNAIFINDHISHNWRLTGQHHHTITPTTKLDAYFDYVSNTAVVRKTGETATDRMQNILSSSAQFRKDWLTNGDNLTARASLKQYIDTAITEFSFPSFSASLANRKPFGKNKEMPLLIRNISAGGGFNLDRKVNHWEALNQYTDNTGFGLSFSENTKYDNFTLSSSQNFSGNYFETMVKNTLPGSNDDYYAVVHRDSSDFSKSLTTTSYLSYNHTLLRYLKLEEKINYQHDLAFRYLNSDGQTINDLADRHTYNFTANANTRIYGIFNTPVGSLQKIRHTMVPNLAFKYTPDFSKADYGYFYYKTISDTSSPSGFKTMQTDKFANSGIGATPKIEESKINYTLGNTFEAKILKKEEESYSHKLFTLNFSGQYDFLATKNKFSDISAEFSSELYNGDLVGKYAGLTLSSDANTLIAAHDWQLKSYNYGYTVNIPMSFTGKINRDFFNQFLDTDSTRLLKKQQVLKEKSVNSFTDMELELKNNLTFRESYNHLHAYSKSFTLDLSAVLKPTQNWKISYNAQLNFQQPEVVTATTISIYRDMHCWEGTFDWNLYNQGFKLLISTKSSIFEDLKFDKDTQKSRW